MKAAIIQHELSSPPGTILDWLRKNNSEYKLYQMSEKVELPSVNEFDLLVICGGSMNVDQESQFKWMTLEKELIKKSILAHKKIVGLCLGAQLVAEALHGKVYKHHQSELGWHPVELLPHLLLRSASSKLYVFQFHSYTFEIPPKAQLLAVSEACRNQAFVSQNNILGFQFHPETTIQWADECSREPHLPVGPYCQTPEVIREMSHYQPALQRWFFDYLDQFLCLDKSGSESRQHNESPT